MPAEASVIDQLARVRAGDQAAEDQLGNPTCAG
jgi:hypothetical protein